MVLKQESLEFDSFFYSTIGNFSKEMSLLMSSFFRRKTVCPGYIPYLIILSKNTSNCYQAYFTYALNYYNFSSNSYLWKRDFD